MNRALIRRKERMLAVVRMSLAFAAGGIGTMDAFAADAPRFKETFPKIGGMFISTPPYESADYQAQLAKHDVVILSFWKGWSRQGKNARLVVQEIKALNPRLLIGNYTILESAYPTTDNAATIDVYNKITSEVGPHGVGNWWARNAAGSMLSHFAGQDVVNITDFVTPDANGDRYPEWFAKWNKTNLFDPVPELDLWYADNVFYQPRDDADWDRDGKNDLRADPVVETYFRQAIAKHVAAVNRVLPQLMVMGNVDGQPALHRGYLRDPEYRGKLAGAFLESAMGQSFSTETWSTWENTLQSYRDLMDNTAAPHLVMFNVKVTRTDYAAMRYGLGTALLHDGYFSINEVNYHDVLWYDEFDLQLGRAIDPPQAAPWQSGVYRRRFENGLVLVNPKGNGTRTVTLEPGYRRFVGTQAPAVNNGQAVTSVTLAARDGLVLLTDPAAGRPLFATQPASQTIAEGGSVAFRAEASSATSYQWQHDGRALADATGALLVLSHTTAADAGSYVCVASNAAGATSSVPATLAVVTAVEPGRLVNLSLLVDMAAGEGPVTLGAVLGGAGTSGSATTLIRAAGPSLASVGVRDFAPDPQLQLFSGENLMASNDDWGGGSVLESMFRASGAFAFASATSKDAALVASRLTAGSYSVQIADTQGRSGTLLAELYAVANGDDATPPATRPRLINLSALKRVGAGQVLTAGFVVGGQMPATVLVRAAGPSLAAFGVSDAMTDPQIELFADARVIATNDDWARDAQIARVAQAVGAFPWESPSGKDAATVLTLAPGSYSVRVSGVGTGAGRTLIEIYEIP